MEGSKLLVIFAVAFVLAFSYQSADAGFIGNQYIITDVENNQCEEIGTWDPSTKTCTLVGPPQSGDSISIQSDDITLDGNGWGLLGIDCVGVGVEVQSGKSNVTIKNITIVAFDIGIEFHNADFSKIKNVRSNNNCDHGLNLIEGSDGNTVTNSDFSDNGDDNILVNNSHENKFEDVTANNSDSDDGFDLEDAENNTFTRITANGNHADGFEIGDSNGNTITDSKINENSGRGIILNYAHANSISNSEVNNNEDEGIELVYSHHNTVTSNEINGNLDSGVDIEDESTENTFSCNEVKNNGPNDEYGAGFEIEEYSNGNEIFKNQIEGNSIGIGLYSNANYNNIFNNNIVNNDVQVENSDSGGDNNLIPNYWGGDLPGPIEHLNSPVNLNDCDKPAISACTMYAGMARFGNYNPQDGSLAIVNLNTGVLQEVGPAANALERIIYDEYHEEVDLGISGLAINKAGKMFASIGGGNFVLGDGGQMEGPDGITGLAEINPATGEIIDDSIEDIPIIFRSGDGEYPIKVVDLAFHPQTDELYGIARGEGDVLVKINTETGEATFEGYIMLTGEEDGYGYANALSFLNDGTLVVTGVAHTDDYYYYGYMPVISFYDSLALDDDYLIPDDWEWIERDYNGLGVSCDNKIYGSSNSEGEIEDTIYLITPTGGEYAEETFVAGKGTNAGDIDFLFTPEPEPEPEAPICTEELVSETISLKSGNPLITAMAGPANSAFTEPFTDQSFEDTRNSPPAFNITAHSAWTAIIPGAEWISPVSTANGEGPTALFAIPFTISSNPIDSATLDISFAVDNVLGSEISEAIFVNNVAVPESGGSGFSSVITKSFDITSMVNSGDNHLYIYQVDLGGPAALLFDATVNVTSTLACPVKENNGGDNQWDTRPTFGISHEDRANQVVENGFSFNTNEYMLTDNHHTDFAEQSVEIGTTNSFSATVYADKKLKIQEFLFGIPNVGEAHLAELGVEVWYDRDGNIDDVKVVQKSDVIDAETVSVSHEKVKCLSTDAEAKCDTTTVSMTFLEPLLDKVMAIKAIDYALRDQRTFLNEGFDISGESLNPMLSSMIPSNVKNQGLLKVTQMAKYSPYWEGEDGRMFEMNSFGSFKQINKSFERFQDTGSASTRQHSGFGGILAYEQDRATDLFDSSKLIAELPESFAYIFPQTGERLTDEMLEQMQLQAEIAQGILDEMDKQDRHY